MARERDDMTAAVNYALGYLEALAGWAARANERESARRASEAIRDYAASVRAARLERDARERDATRERDDGAG